MATCPPAGWNRKTPPQDDEYQGWHSEDNRGREAGDEHSYCENGHAPARHGRQGSEFSPPGSFDDRRRSDQGASYNDGPECTPFEDGYGDYKSPQDRIERLNVPKPKGGAWGNVSEAIDPFEEGDKRRHEQDLIFEKDSGQAVINFDAYEDIPVKVSGEDVPKPILNFSEAALEERVAANLARCRYKKPTPVQKYAIPIGLARRDLMACAQTGSGKTAAFCFPIISSILSSEDKEEIKSYSRRAYPKALIMGPTRELTNQIYEESRKFTYQTGLRPAVVYGGPPQGEQLRQLDRGCDILIATPGRLNSFIQRGRISLSRTRYLVLDEADRMLDMGFEPQIRSIVEGADLPSAGERQTLMFSATFPKDIQQLAADFMSNYLFLAVGRVGSSTNLIIQHFEEVEPGEKQKLLVRLVRAVPGLTLVFTETKNWADRLENFLIQNDFPATTIHGDLSQEEREYSLEQFRCGTKPILVATDVASRGLDIPHVTHVINYDLPRDIESYVHRIGRTGRAGKKGISTAFYTPGKDSNLAEALLDLAKETNQIVPEFLVEEAKSAGPYSAPPSRRSSGGFGGRDYREGYSRGGLGARGGGAVGGGYERLNDSAYGGGKAYGGGGQAYGGVGHQNDCWGAPAAGGNGGGGSHVSNAQDDGGWGASAGNPSSDTKGGQWETIGPPAASKDAQKDGWGW